MSRSMFRIFFLGVALVAVLSGGFAAPTVRAATSGSFEDINAPKGTTTQGIIFAGICTSASAACSCRDSGDCSLDDLLQVFVNLSTFILGISGSAALFVFVYGGFKWLLSRGESKWIEEGKAAMTAGAIGLVIIFGSYAALNFIISGLTTPAGTTPTPGNLEKTVKGGLDSTDASRVPDTFTTE